MSNNSSSNEGRNTSIVRRNETVRDSSNRRQTSTSFFAIFNERPVRRRYYRQINRSATNLVRRLSQSRLFLNSTRSQNAIQRNNSSRRYRREVSTRTETESEAMCDGLNEVISLESTHDDNDDVDDARGGDDNMEHRICVSTHSLNVSNDNHENVAGNRLSAIRTCASESDIFSSNERSETPPPPYHFVAHGTRANI